METIAFTPEWLKNKDGEPERPIPVFHLRLASILERDQFEAEIEGVYRAAEVPAFELRDIALEGIRALASSDDIEELVQLVLSQYGGEDLSTDEQAKIKGVFDVLAEHWPEYRTAREQEARRNHVLPTLAFLRWCTGWQELSDKEGKPIEYARLQGAIPDAVLRRISPIIIRSVGVEAWRIQYGRTDAKN